MKKSFYAILLSFTVILFPKHMVAQTSGTLTVTFTPVAHSPCYQGTKSVMAAWIQTNAGGFVKTKLRYVGSVTSDHLPTWAVNSGGPSSNCLSSLCNITDASTGATLNSFTTKTFTWDGKGVNGALNGSIVADGIYKVTIQETWNHNASSTTIKSYTFTKGAVADHQTPANDADFTNIKLDWVPASSDIASFEERMKVAVYPNPSEGIITIEYNKAGIVKVMNAIGEMVYEEKLADNESGSKNIDLSNLTNGIYTINYLSGHESSNFKVVLLK